MTDPVEIAKGLTEDHKRKAKAVAAAAYRVALARTDLLRRAVLQEKT